MNILLVSSYLPFPLTNGGSVRLFNIIKQLSKNHTITLVCEIRTHQTEDDVLFVKKYCKEVITVKRKKQWSLQTIIKTGISKESFLVTGHTHKAMKEKISNLLSSESFDLIHVETFYVMQNIPKTSLPIVLVEHNIEFLVYKRYAKTMPFWARPLLLLDVQKLKKTEMNSWKKATKLVAVSEQEKKLMGIPGVVVVPNGVDIAEFNFSESKKNGSTKHVLFIGNFKWLQNKDSAKFIISSIWPKVKKIENENKSKLQYILWIVGKHIPPSLKNISNDSSIVFDENASSNTAEIFKKSLVLLAPIRVGGGTSFKILEAMASGVAVLTTPLGVEGIGARDNEEVVLANTGEEFSEKLIKLASDEKMRNELIKNARRLIEEKYDWGKIVKILEGVYKSAIS